MFVSTALLLVFIPSALSLPSPHLHIRSCHKSIASALSSSATSTLVSVDDTTNTVLNFAATPTSTSKKSSSTKVSDSEATGSASSSGDGSSIQISSSALFPAGISSLPSWTTSDVSSNPISLSDSSLGASHVGDQPHPVVAAPDGKMGIQSHYSKGSFDYQGPEGGVDFYAGGPSSVDLTTAKEATLAYSVYFDEGFEFNKGGKMPGLYGGDTPDGSLSCSGGRITPECFSTRMMWRRNGMGELYAYVPPESDPQFAANNNFCNIPPYSTCAGDYGKSVGRGAWTWQTGQWNTVGQRVRLNDAGQANGEVEIFINGQSIFTVSGVILRQSGEGRIRGIQFQSFFGGHDETWASPRDQDAYFADLSVAILEEL